MTCKEFVEVITDYLEARLDPAEHRRLEAHLARCEGCSAYLEQMRQTIAVAGRLREKDVSVARPRRDVLLEAFRSWKRAGR